MREAIPQIEREMINPRRSSRDRMLQFLMEERGEKNGEFGVSAE